MNAILIHVKMVENVLIELIPTPVNVQLVGKGKLVID